MVDLILFIIDLLSHVFARGASRHRDTGKIIRLRLNEQTDNRVTPDMADSVPVETEKTGAIWFALGGALIFVGTLIYPADAVNHGFQANPWIVLVLVAVGIGVCFRLALAVLSVVVGLLVMLSAQAQVVFSWAACYRNTALCADWQSQGAAQGVFGSTLVLIVFAVLCFWIIRTVYRQWDILRM
jgi:hypothetical protein